MKINDWDIVNADARQWNVTPGFHSVSNESKWTEGSPLPALLKNDIGFKSLKVVLLIKRDGGRAAILARCSEILAHLLDPVDLTLDGFPHFFCGILTKHSHKENVLKRWHTLTLEFDGYEHGEEQEVTASGETSISMTNEGNIVTPMILTITPQIGLASVALTGVCRDPVNGDDLPVTVGELTTGNAVVIDGETGLMTQGEESKAGDIEIWALPSLLPGENTITVDSDRVDLSIRYRPRYM